MISVIIPVYQAEKYLKRCVDSVLSQTFQNLEVILIDDGSKDNSGEICDQYAASDNRVKVLHKTNAGVAAARNSGLEMATGDYIAFVDSDDYIDSQMYQSMMSIAEEYQCDVVMCDCVKEFDNYQEIYTHNVREGYYSREQIEKEHFPHLLMMPNVEYPPTISNWLCLFKRKENANLRYEEGIRFSEDLLFGAQLLYQAKSFYYMKGSCFYHYWMNPQSATHTFKRDKWNDYKKLHKRIKEIFSKSEIYDFTNQTNLVLLFFVYNSVGEIINTNELDEKEKINLCNIILNSCEVKKMFSELEIIKLPISHKLKLLTYMYKYKIGLQLLVKRCR